MEKVDEAVPPKQPPIAFDEFITVPRFAFRLIGIRISEQQFAKKNFQVGPLHFLSLLLLTINISSGMLYFLSIEMEGLDGLRQKIFVTISIIYVGALISISLRLHFGQTKLTLLTNEFCKCFPSHPEDQKNYRVAECAIRTKRRMMNFIIFQAVVFYGFSSFLTIGEVRKYIKNHEWSFEFPFLLWYPFDPYQRGVFPFCYVEQMTCSAFLILTILAFVVLMCVWVEQLRMHFNQLGRAFKHLNSSENDRQTEQALVKEYVEKQTLINKYDMNDALMKKNI